jgi:MYXO-CTERM domain-containing protein
MKIAALIAAAGIAGLANANVIINEFQPNPFGADPATNSIELRGTAGESFSGWLTALDTDPGTATGFVNDSFFISGTFDANGLLVASIGDFENPSFTLVLAQNEITAGTSVDADQDGTIDNISIFGTVFDAVDILDVADDFIYADDFGGTTIAFSGDEPRLAFRDGINLDWYVVNDPDLGVVIDAFGNEIDPSLFFGGDPLAADTFGFVNPTVVPTPAAVALLGMGGLVAGRRRRA